MSYHIMSNSKCDRAVGLLYLKGVTTCKFSTLDVSKGYFIGGYYLKFVKFKAPYCYQIF